MILILINAIKIKMLNSFKTDKLEVGIDEAGRGCLAGRVYCGAVILPNTFEDDMYLQIKDSKKLTKKKRDELRKYIENNALAYAVGYSDVNEIDSINILQATLVTMHRVIDKLSIKPEHILVDGNRFNVYMDSNDEVIQHTLITAGDNKYRNIAAASILAKTYHDDYVEDLIAQDKSLKKYGWETNMCYGTKKHMDAIKKYGITKHHRLSFRPCQI